MIVIEVLGRLSVETPNILVHPPIVVLSTGRT